MSDDDSPAHRPPRRGPITALELWHPRGVAATQVAFPADVSAGRDPGERADLIVVALDSRAAGERIASSIASAAAQLADDGVLWVLVGRRWRARAERAVTARGLELRARVLTLPAWPASEHFVPLEPDLLRDTAVRHLNMGPLRARGLSALARTAAGRRALARLVPACALIATRSRGVPLHGWLGQLDGGSRDVTIAVACSDRRNAPVATVLRFRPGRDLPDLVVKRGLGEAGDERVRTERVALSLLGDAAVEAGFAVPVPLAGADDATLASHPLRGPSAAWSLAHRRAPLVPLATALGDRLLSLARATATATPASRALVDALLGDPAIRIARTNPAIGPYADALRSLAGRLQRDGSVVVCATHGDLSMSNLLLADGEYALIDWESASPRGIALGDLWYALADALTCARGINHARAVEALVTAAPPAIRELPQRHATALGLTDDQALLGFHACWLQHATDELDRGVRGPFLDVVDAVARARLNWPA